jgi:hypothetical protein
VSLKLKVDIGFWSLDARWPRDPKGWVFLGRAIQQVGKSLFPADWNGGEYREGGDLIFQSFGSLNEKVLFAKYMLNNSLNITSFDVSSICIRDRKIDEKISVLIAEHGLSITDIETAQNHDISLMEGHRRFCKAAELIAASISDYEIPFALRAIEGGDIKLQKTNGCWNTENLSHFFENCQIDGRIYITETGDFAVRSCYIFVSEPHLRDLLAAQNGKRSAVPPPPSSGYRSPYMAVMEAVAISLNITPENQPKKAVVEAELLRLWTSDKPLTKRLIEPPRVLRRPFHLSHAASFCSLSMA